MITHISTKIQNAIQLELFGAQKSIKIAVSWFTNELLFQPLLLKLQAGVSVEIILNDDDINRSADGLNFDSFSRLGGTLGWNNSKQLMHDKFCIIDEKVVISGSYNWTNKAEYNDEHRTIFKEEPATTKFFISKFSELSKKYGITKNTVVARQRIKNTQLKPRANTTDNYDTIQNLLAAAIVSDDDWKQRIVVDGIQYSPDGKRLLKCNLHRPYIEIKHGVTIICNGAFENCEDIEYIKIPNGVKCIGKEAFRCCKKLKTINLPNSTQVIGESAFCGCRELYEVVMPNVEVLGSKCFGYTKSLQEITIPSSINSIEGNPIVDSCVTNIRSNSSLYKVVDGILYGEKQTKVVACLQEKSHIQLPPSVKYIEDFAFYRCKELISIKLPQNTISIGNEAFGECSNLKEVHMGNKVEVIKASAFHCCRNLGNVTFSNTLKKIHSYAFSCSGLKSIVLPNSVIEICDYAFHACQNLESVILSGKLQIMGECIFDGCTKIKEIRLPSTITSDLGRTFRGCSVPKIIIPKGTRAKFEMLLIIKDCYFPDIAKTHINKICEE